MRFALQDSRRTLKVNFGEFVVSFSAENLDEFVAQIGKQRALMVPPVERHTPASDTVAPEDPMWEITNTSTHTVLRIRDPRFGWLRYGFTPERQQEFEQAIIARAARRKP